jgi:hypothetical protein
MDVRRQWDQDSTRRWHMAHIPIGIRDNLDYVQQTARVLKNISHLVRLGGHDCLYVYDRFAGQEHPADGLPIQMCDTSNNWLLAFVPAWENLWIAVCKRYKVTLKALTSREENGKYVPWSVKRRRAQVHSLVKTANSQSH